MRPSRLLLFFLIFLFCCDAGLLLHRQMLIAEQSGSLPKLATTVSGLGLTDLAVATEARYTRHPAVSDSVAPFMDHPGAIEHFPTGTFWVAPTWSRNAR